MGMSIRVSDSARVVVREQPDQLVLEVTGAGASAAEMTRSALASARGDIGALGAQDGVGAGRSADANTVKYVSGVLPTANGGALFIDGGSVPGSVLETIPEIIARHLEAVGVEEACIAAPSKSEELVDLGRVPRAVVLRLGAPPTYRRGRHRVIPPPVVEAAAQWLVTGMGQDDPVRVAQAGAEFALSVSGVRAFLVAAHSARVVRSTVVAGDIDGRIRAGTGAFLGGSIALAAGGPATTDDDLAQAFAELRDFARHHTAEIAYAFIDIASTFDTAIRPTPHTGWTEGDGESPERIQRACDEVLFDAFPYQLIGPQHRARLGATPPAAKAVGDGRLMELELGDLPTWMPTHPARDSARADARAALRPCLLQYGEARDIIKQRTRERLA